MKNVLMRNVSVVVLVCLASWIAPAQRSSAPAEASSAVPKLVNYSGVLTDVNGKPLRDVAGVTFLLYRDQQGGAPLWMETQNVTPDRTGHYTVMLGATNNEGLPVDVFANGQARWLAVQVAGQPEQARVLLVAVPYAFKAKDAETIGGLPPSAFVMAGPLNRDGAPADSAKSTYSASSAPPPVTANVTTSGGTVNALPLFTTATNVESSAISQTGTGTAAKLTLRGTIVIPATGGATAAGGKTSEPINVTASTFNSVSSTAVGQTFQLKTEPVNSNTANPDASFNLLFGHAANTPAETGFSIASNGQITFAPGQTFPGAGTITGVTAGTDLTGGGSSGNVTLNLDTTKVPQLGAANTFTGAQTVNGNVTATGRVTGSGFNIGANLFAFGAYAKQNAFLGFAGNTAMTGISNTATGYLALQKNTTGTQNTATGANALNANAAGSWNTATGVATLLFNTSGNYNTAIGVESLLSNTTGNNNAALGGYSLFTNTTGSSNTAAGTNALTSNTTGSQNTASGMNALTANKTANDNTASGFKTLYANISGGQNTAVGSQALYNNTASANTATGYTALYNNTTGTGNTAGGFSALYANTTGIQNTGEGYWALAQNTSGGSNTGAGFDALTSNTLGNNNAGFGYAALAGNTTGSYNSAFGWQAGYNFNKNITGSNNTFLGANSGPGVAAKIDNATAIGANAVVSASNSLVLGAAGVNVGIGTAAPTANLEVAGSVKVSGAGNGITFPDNSVQTTASGNIAGVIAGTDLTGGGVSGTVTLNLDTTKVPQLNAANIFTGNQTVNGNVGITGVVAASSFQIGANLFAFGDFANYNSFLGFAGNTSMTGANNTASGIYALNSNTTGYQNTANGSGALFGNTTGFANTAAGYQALVSNSSGSANTAIGYQALYNNNGGQNVATGAGALYSNIGGLGNIATGLNSLYSNTSGVYNNASGVDALYTNTTGGYNVAIGHGALGLNPDGSRNIALGFNAAGVLTSGSNNIHIGNAGLSSESNTIRIGTGGSGGHTAFYVAGVLGTNIASGSQVYISGTGQLGVVSSSRRYKDDIQDMGEASQRVLQLRPVTFRYKQPAPDGSKPLQYGLIAEEVAEVYPDAVGYNALGQPDSVEYHKINAMLLNEVQRQNLEIEELKAAVAELKAQMRTR